MCDVKNVQEAAGRQRDGRGRFVRGNKGGPGNPFARVTAGFRKALLGEVRDEDLQKVARKLIAMSLEGNVAAIRVLLAYAVGRPVEAVDPDELDVNEWELFKKEADMEEGVGKVLDSMDPMEVLLMGREVLPTLRAGDRGVIKPWQKIDGTEDMPKPRPTTPAPSTNGDGGVEEKTDEGESGQVELRVEVDAPATPPSTNRGDGAATKAEEPSTNGGEGLAEEERRCHVAGRVTYGLAKLIQRESREIDAQRRRAAEKSHDVQGGITRELALAFHAGS